MSPDLPSLDSPLSSLLSSFGSVFSQNARLLRLRFANDSTIAPDLLLPQRLSGTEALSACYRYELECLSADMHIELKDLLGQPVEIGLLLADGDERVMAGVITQAKQLGGDGGFARYGLRVEPAIATLAHRMNSRVFQDKSVPDIVTAVLEEHDMVIVSADNGRNAIKKLQSEADIDIVLMDIMMPGMDGMETMREIRKLPHLKDLPIVAVTAKAMRGDREKCIEAGAWDYLSKPVDTTQMLAVLRAWLHQ